MIALRALPKVLVFDSGVGGFSIVREIAAQNINVEIDYCADTGFFPYGNRSDLELLDRIPQIIAKAAVKSKADILIIACNTASTLALWQIRQIAQIPVIGVVPAIKPACIQSITKTIGLLATPRTVGSAYTNELIDNFGQGCNIIRYAPEGLARAAEKDFLNEGLDSDAIKDAVEGLFTQDGADKIDTIVLACTHYPLVLSHLKATAEKYTKQAIVWLDSGKAIARRLQVILDEKFGNSENTSEIAQKVTQIGVAYITSDLNSTSGGDFYRAALRLGFKQTIELEK